MMTLEAEITMLGRGGALAGLTSLIRALWGDFEARVEIY